MVDTDTYKGHNLTKLSDSTYGNSLFWTITPPTTIPDLKGNWETIKSLEHMIDRSANA